MKKNLFFLSSGISLLLAACSGGSKESSGPSATTKKNMEVSKAIGDCFETKDFSKLSDYLAPDFVDYAGETGPVKGIEANKQAFEKMVSGFDSLTNDEIKVLADDEYVMAWMKFKAKVLKDAMGMKAGSWMETSGIELTKFKDGKAIEHWTFMEPGEVMKMMGGVPPGAETGPMPPVKDTATQK